MDDTSHRRVPASLARLCQALQRAADEERTRLSRQLHDSASQSLAAAAMSLSIVERELVNSEPASREAFTRAQQMIISACRELGELSSALHPPLLGETGLPSALRTLARRLGIERFALSVDALGATEAEIGMTLYRLAEQALSELFALDEPVTGLLRGRDDQLAICLEGKPRTLADEALTELSLRQRVLAGRGRLKLKRTDGTLVIEARFPREATGALDEAEG